MLIVLEKNGESTIFASELWSCQPAWVLEGCELIVPSFSQICFHQLYSKPFILKLNPHGPALSISAYCMGMWLIPKPLTFSDLYCCQDTLHSFPSCSALQKKMSTVGFFCLNYHATGISFIMQIFFIFLLGKQAPPSLLQKNFSMKNRVEKLE